MPPSQRESDFLRPTTQDGLQESSVAYQPILINNGVLCHAIATSSSSLDISLQSLRLNNAELPNEAEFSNISREHDLWDRAFDALRARDEKLVAKYERHLPREAARPTVGQLPGAQRETQLQGYISDKLTSQEKSGKLRDLGDKAIKIIIFAKGFIADVVSTDPHASLAWTGVCLLLPLLLNPSVEKEAMLTGVETIAKIITRYLAIERTYRGPETKPALKRGVQPDSSLTELFEGAIVNLYSKILEYQARCVCKLSQPKALQFARSMFKIGNQDPLLEGVKSCNAECESYFGFLDKALLQREYDKQQRRHDELFSSVTKGLSLLQTTAEESLSIQKSLKRDKQEERCLHKLRGSVDYEKNKDRDQQGVRIPNTCRWVLHNPKFIDWRDDKSLGFLFITADPGCGKTVLARSLIDEKLLGPADTVVCHYFFRHDDRREAWEMLGILLYQLFDQRPDLIKHAVPYARKDGLFSKSVSTLWEILERVADDGSLPAVVCVLDAFDEGLDDWETKRFVDELVCFYTKFDTPHDHRPRRLPKLKFIITSRPYREVEMAFGKFGKSTERTRLCINDGDNEILLRDEIEFVIRTKVSTLREKLNLKEEVADLLRRHLLEMENRTYLCISLILELVATSAVSINITTSKRMRKFLSNIPSGLGHIYEAILQRVPISEEGEKLLRIIITAVRPLSVPEMRIASSIEEETHSFHDLDVEAFEDFVLKIRNQCSLFVNVVDDKIYLIHQTAKEFLLQKSSQFSAASSSAGTGRIWQHSLDIAHSNELLAWACIRYLCFVEFNAPDESKTRKRGNHDVFNEGPDQETANGSSLASDDILYRQCSSVDSTVVFDPRYWDQILLKSRFRKHQFLEYASSHWTLHYRLSKSTIRKPQLFEQSLSLCNVQSNLCRNWFGTLPEKENRSLDFFKMPYEDKLIEGSEDLLFCSFIGHDDGVEHLLQHLTQNEGCHGTAIQDTRKAALYLSIQEGHSDCVKALLAPRPKSIINDALMINREGIFQNQETNGTEISALRVAIQNGQLHLVQLLLEHGANPNIFGATNILFDALQCKRPATEIEKIVSLLLEHHADPNISGAAKDSTLFSMAKSLGLSESILCTLFKNDGRDQDYDSGETTNMAEGLLYGLQFLGKHITSFEKESSLDAFGSDLTLALSSVSRLEPWCDLISEEFPHEGA